MWVCLVGFSHFSDFICACIKPGICQRDACTYYAHLSARNAVSRLAQLIGDFFRSHVRDAFSSTHYVFDCYVDGDDRVWLVDFNPFCASTDMLMFTAEELLAAPGNFSKLLIDIFAFHFFLLQSTVQSFVCTSLRFSVSPQVLRTVCPLTW